MSSVTKKILVVDDEQFIRDALSEFITETLDFEVELAEDGEIALQTIKANPEDYSIIITDLKMPNIDGLDLIRHAKNISDDYVFVIITGFATKENAISALKHGAYDFIHKPFNVSELTAVINRANENWTLRMDNKNYQRNLEKLVDKRTKEIKTLNADLQKFINLSDSIYKIADFRDKINEFQDNLREKFAPDTIIIMLYDNFTKSFKSPIVKASRDLDVFFPEDDNLLAKEKVSFLNGDKDDSDPLLHLNKNDSSFYFRRMEHEKFLGYLYMGFENSNNRNISNTLNLYASNLETILYNEYLVSLHQREMEKMFLSGIKVIADTVEANSPFTRKHSDRVEKIATFLADKLNFSYDRKYRLSVACILHDIGKVGIDSRIVYKPGALTFEERVTMQKHPVLGAKIVKDLYGFSIDRIIKHHHERWDGTGYPDELKGDEIPLESRIIAIADAFDSMITDRPYRNGLPMAEVLKEIEDCSGTQFDPTLAKLFLSTISHNSSEFKLALLSEGN